MIWTSGARRRARTLLPVIGLVGGLAGMAACSDGDLFNVVVPPINNGAVLTFKDSTFNFTTLHTFAMPDTVIHFAPVTGNAIDISRQYDAVLLNQVRQDFLARGYTQVADPKTVKPDFVVLVGATATQNYNAWVGYSWYGVWGFYPGWGWYAPGFDTSWGIVFPWYPVVGVTAYDRGTILVTLIPTLSVNPLAKSITPAWAGVATGLLNGTVTSTTITNAVDAMFAQSPYLTATP
jgi:hypothetical protein